ncbi:VTT domain-containing protein [Methylophaga sp.]|uniref:TVP38/TMEM64 family protein n=1 Tax=Methylophaga sp. TaxID=2024840 RepID=UPI00140130CF|nr:VTT domain-containing protein [Methylophaga sp.]MTI63445.1 TVP38/TMEM64 family protein [Methylophaga sp.]
MAASKGFFSKKTSSLYKFKESMPQSIKRSLLIFIALLVMTLLWRYLIDAGYISNASVLKLAKGAQQFEYSLWGLLIICLLYTVLLAVMFPLTLLVVTTGMLFQTEWAIFCALLGSLMSSAASYVLGHCVGRESIEKHGGAVVRRAESFIQNNSFKSMVIINLLPIAPFTMTNMLAGAFKLDFRRYMVGSSIGLLPGLVVVIAFGGQLGRLLVSDQNISWSAFFVAILLIALFFGFLLWLTKRLGR